uniref:Putative secreted protein n=1 Tax=Ixodes ricinus TaxID=34613 RepID=A0A6B0URR2_IXORI
MSLIMSCSVREPTLVFSPGAAPLAAAAAAVESSPFCTAAEQPLVACMVATRCFLRGGDDPPPSSELVHEASLAAREAFLLNCFFFGVAVFWKGDGEGGGNTNCSPQSPRTCFLFSPCPPLPNRTCVCEHTRT